MDNSSIPLTPEVSQDDAVTKFPDIAPYGPSQFHQKLENLSREPGFEHAVRYVMPGVDFDAFRQNLLSVKNQHEFQTKIMAGFLDKLSKQTTSGITSSGMEHIKDSVSYTFISNHRDIVLDASFLNLCLLRANKPLTQVAIGNNLLIFEWITDLVKLNRSFIVKRDVKRLDALKAARELSAYIHYTIGSLHESVWIAQREGRAKDSNDLTQESLLKMLALAGNADKKQALMEVNLMPVAISYEYDPNDYLKVREYLLKKRDPEFKKCQHDDLLSMETGLMGQKGRVHFHVGPCINEELATFDADARGVTKFACELVDRTIHRGYCLFPANYIAYDRLEGGRKFGDKYSREDEAVFDDYLNAQLKKINVPAITEEERRFMFDTMLSMYANPVRNQLATYH